MNDFDNRRSADVNDNENTADSAGGAMMSIFASYYGIEDSVQSSKSPGDLIDSAHFDCNAFVKVITILCNPSHSTATTMTAPLFDLIKACTY